MRGECWFDFWRRVLVIYGSMENKNLPKYANKEMDAWMDGWTYGRMDGWMDERMEKWIDRWTSG